MLKGKCMCGAVTVEMEPAREGLSICHCDMCRAWSSSAFMGIEAAKGSLKADGPVKVFTSSPWAERAFCNTCGSALWYCVTAQGPMHGQKQVAAGLFENAGGLTPRLEVFIDKKPTGYALKGERRTMTEAEVFAIYAPSEEGEPQ